MQNAIMKVAPRRIGTLSVRLGGWFEAKASGWGVLAIPALTVLAIEAAVRWPLA